MNIRQQLSSQFGRPNGCVGSIAGFIMTHRTSNRERNTWAVDLLNLQFSDTVLEIGFGPGLALEMMSKFISSGKIYGIDHSQVMYSLARARNQNAIAAGRMELFLGSVAKVPMLARKIDKVLDVNSFQFWEDPLNSLLILRKCMNKGGTIALVHQPRKPGATESDADEAGHKIMAYLKDAGFERIILHKKNMKPVTSVCVMGIA